MKRKGARGAMRPGLPYLIKWSKYKSQKQKAKATEGGRERERRVIEWRLTEKSPEKTLDDAVFSAHTTKET